MKVLLVSVGPEFVEDGPAAADTLARHAVYVARLQARAPGSEVRVLSLVRGRAGRGGWAARGPLQAAWIGLDSLPGALASLAGLLVSPGLFRDWRPDLVACQSPLEDGLFSWLLARRLGARHMTQVHFQRRQVGTDYRGALRRLLPPLVLRLTDRIRFVSRPQRDEFLAAYRLDPERSNIAPVPMVLQALADADPGPPADRRGPLVLFAGRFVAQKNLDDWLEVAVRVTDQVPGARFVLAGDGPLRPYVETCVREGPLAGYVTFAGVLATAELADLYRRAAVFLLTSHDDAFGRVVAEAGAFGIPVVSTRCGGPEEILVDRATGCLFAHGDIDGMADAVAALLSDPALRARIGAAAHERVHAEYALEPLADRIAAGWVEAAHG
jgi:glycosyltransferase involved in cell wall biosynthesis